MKNKYISALLILIGVCHITFATPREKFNFNPGWLLETGDVKGGETPLLDDSSWLMVTLPHAFNEDEAFRKSIEKLTDTVCWYRKHFTVPQLQGKTVFAVFQDVPHVADFYLNVHHL